MRTAARFIDKDVRNRVRQVWKTIDKGFEDFGEGGEICGLAGAVVLKSSRYHGGEPAQIAPIEGVVVILDEFANIDVHDQGAPRLPSKNSPTAGSSRGSIPAAEQKANLR